MFATHPSRLFQVSTGFDITSIPGVSEAEKAVSVLEGIAKRPAEAVTDAKSSVTEVVSKYGKEGQASAEKYVHAEVLSGILKWGAAAGAIAVVGYLVLKK